MDTVELSSLQICKLVLTSPQDFPKVGLIPPDQWNISRLRANPGLIIIKNPFTPVGQRYWVRKLLSEYTKHPNKNNLLPSMFSENVIRNFWESLTNEKDVRKQRSLKKSMRWSTLGYHYDWTNKVYDEDSKDEFPRELSDLVATVANSLGFPSYKSEAAIINFYPIGSTLSAHTDHSEFFLDSPLFSISFGQSAIFLIGGLARENEAFPILLNSGDIVVMSKESRLCYHAVPRVFPSDFISWQTNHHEEDLSRCIDLDQQEVKRCLNNEEWKPFNNYLVDSRINVNVRRVNK